MKICRVSIFLPYICAENRCFKSITSFATPCRLACFWTTLILYCNCALVLLICFDAVFGTCTFFVFVVMVWEKLLLSFSLSRRLFLSTSLQMSSVRMSFFSVNRTVDDSVAATPASLQLLLVSMCLPYVCAGNRFLKSITSFAVPCRVACFWATFTLYFNCALCKGSVRGLGEEMCASESS